MNTEPSIPTEKTPTDNVKTVDRPIDCMRCGYNLYLQPEVGRCPECGTAVARSLKGDSLRFCDPQWIRTVWRGLNCLGLLCIGYGALWLYVWLYATFFEGYGHSSDFFDLFLPALIFSTAAALGLLGWWLSTTPEPGMTKYESLLCARRLARLLLGVFVAIFVAIFASAGWLNITLPEVIFVSAMIIAAALDIMFILIYACSLAKRVPHKWLVRMTTTFLLLIPTFGLFVPFYQLDWFNWTNTAEGIWDRFVNPDFYKNRNWNGINYFFWDTYMLGVEVINWILILIVPALGGLLFWYWRVFKREAKVAWSTWATQETVKVGVR